MANIDRYIDKIQVPDGSNTITNYLIDNISGYSKSYIVTLYYDSDTQEYSTDHSFSTILTAYNSHKYSNFYLVDPTCTFTDPNIGENVVIIANLTSVIDDYSIKFEGSSADSYNNYYHILYSIDDDGIWIEAPDSEAHHLPYVNTYDNGKIVKVINGAWTLADESAGGTQVSIIRYIEA